MRGLDERPEKWDTSARDPEGVHRLALSRQRRARINPAAAARERHAGHDQDPFTLLAGAELRSIAAGQDATGPAESAARDPQRLRRALARGDADFGSGERSPETLSPAAP